MPGTVSKSPPVEARRPHAHAGPGIDEATIHRVVHGFYDRARQDALLGPVFEERVANWPAHLGKMVDFWSAAIMRTGRYRGRPAAAHEVIDGISTVHFQRWLELFAATVCDLCTPDQAAVFVGMADRMGRGLTAALRLAPPMTITI